MRRNVAGALSLVALVAGERKPPHVAGMHLTTSRGPFLNLHNSRIAAKRCHYNRGGYMTLAQFAALTDILQDIVSPDGGAVL